jgi:hypothetical protein
LDLKAKGSHDSFVPREVEPSGEEGKAVGRVMPSSSAASPILKSGFSFILFSNPKEKKNI